MDELENEAKNLEEENLEESELEEKVEESKLEEKIDELTELVKENNKILRRGRNAKRAKVTIIIVVVLCWFGYLYYLYHKHQPRITETLDRIGGVRSEAEDLVESVGRLKSSVDSAQDILGGATDIIDTYR